MEIVFPKAKYGHGSGTLNEEINAMTNKLAGEKLFTFKLLATSKDLTEGLNAEEKKCKNYSFFARGAKLFGDRSGEEVGAEKLELPLRTIIELF
ncbi:MAG: hypothetical protein NY202_02135 [Mollicutes bacterium UO1]